MKPEQISQIQTDSKGKPSANYAIGLLSQYEEASGLPFDAVVESAIQASSEEHRANIRAAANYLKSHKDFFGIKG